jgi:hypothetical protein
LKSVRIWSNRHRGADVYVLGAGASLDHLDPAWFAGKITVAVNEVASTWGIKPSFTVLKEFAESLLMAAANHPDVPLIVSRHSYGDPGRGFRPIDETPFMALPNLYVFDHLPNRSGDFDAARDWPSDDGSLVVSMSTITSAMHFAAYLGAGTIFMVGHDCGQLGDAAYMKGYGKAEAAMGYAVQNVDWLIALERQSRAVKAQLRERYGVRVWGLSPFISPDLEGTPFRGTNVLNLDTAVTAA